LGFTVSSSGTIGFQRFAANLRRIRKTEAGLAQEQVLRREGFRASLTDHQSDDKPSLGPLLSGVRSLPK
jgi:hypothetical protein